MVGVLLVVSAVVAGCGSSGSGDSDGSSAGSGGAGGAVAKASKSTLMGFTSSGKIARNLDAAPTPPKPIQPPCKIAVLFAYNIEFFQNVGYGVSQEAKKLGCTTTIQSATGYGDTTNQLQQFDTALAQQPDAIIVHPADQKAIAPAVDRAWKQGIPVVYDEDFGPSKNVYAVLTDDHLAGFRQGAFIGKADPHAQVIAMCGPPGIAWSTERCKGLKEGLASTAPQAKVVAEKFHAMDTATVTTVAGNTMQAFPDAKWVYNSTDLEANGVVDALKNKHFKPGQVKVTSLTIGREMLRNLQDGWVQYALAERPVLNGRLAVDMAVGLLEGDNPAASIWEPNHPGVIGKAGAKTFCEGSCDNVSDGEERFNWAPPGYKF